MKKTILIFSLCLFGFAGMQSVNAQTQEETIEWIKESFEKYFQNGRAENFRSRAESIRITPCEISVSVYLLYDDGHREKWGDYYFKTTNTFIVNPEKPEYLKTVGKVIKKESDGRIYYYDFLRFSPTEPNIGARMKKAIEHLATFCDDKELF